MNSEHPTFQYSVEGKQEKTGEILKSPEDIWGDLMYECETVSELKILEDHVHLFKMGPNAKPSYFLILSDVKPEGKEMYLSRFDAHRMPVDIDTFLLAVKDNRALKHLPLMFNPTTSEVFEISGYNL